MMRCARAQEELSACLDEELTAQEMAELRAHLEGCAACRAELEALRRTVESVRALPRTRAPAGFRDSVMAKLKDAPAPAVGGTGEPAEVVRVPLWRKLWPVAAALIVAALISQLYPTTRPVPQNVQSAARRGELTARATEFDKLEPAITVAEGGAREKAAPTAASDEKAMARAKDAAAAPEERAAVAARPEDMGKVGASAARKEGDERLFAKAPEPPRETMSNAMPAYAKGQQSVMPDQATASADTPLEFVIASADPDHARQVAQGVLEKRGWLARTATQKDLAAAKAKTEAVAARTIRVNLTPDQIVALRQELTQAGLAMLPAQRDQAVQSLAAAVRLEDEKQRAAGLAAPAAPAGQQMTQQRSAQLAAGQQPQPVQEDQLQFQRADAPQRAGTILVVLKFIAAENAAQTGEAQQAAPNPPPAQGK